MGLSIKRRVTLDLSQRGAQVTIPFSVGDTVAHEVIFTIRDGAELVELPEGVVAAIAIKNGYGGTGCLDSCVIDHVNNTVIYTPTVEALDVEGNISCTMRLSDTDGAVIGTPTFIFAVSEGDNANTEAEISKALVSNPNWDYVVDITEKAGQVRQDAEYVKTEKQNLENVILPEIAKNVEDVQGQATAAADSAQAAADSESNSLDIVSAVMEYADQTHTDAENAKNSAEAAKGYYLWAQQEADRALEYGTNLIEQTEGTNDKKVMSQKAVTDALAKKVNLSDLGNSGGSSVEIAKGPGQSETAVMSQKAATDSFVPKTKSKDGDSAYCAKTDGTIVMIPISFGTSNNSGMICGKDAKGVVQVGTPTRNPHATPKSYVDTADSIRYCPTVSNEEGVQLYSVPLVGLDGGNANYAMHRRCIIPCNGHSCSPGVDISLSNATVPSSSDCKIFRWDNLPSQDLSISFVTPNTISVRPAHYCSSNFMLVLDIYYYNDGSYKMLYISSTGGTM